ncbi:hypothetical protein WK00_03045 [Burkholderia ubonensis]|nr:hypothetical protein WJ87_12410 [Burkholderia ubonensis]KVQ14600.1 hypothetical protein WK00_03045 [Burkholderia ubonensis]KVU74659.1 hypothetical protein WK71_00555 [Burkholderia ubonensis]KWB64511.1 hypothetical protein WL38_18595 [Burkholderia ubonensis]
MGHLILNFLLQPIKPAECFKVSINSLALGNYLDPIPVYPQVPHPGVFVFMSFANIRSVVSGDSLHHRTKSVVIQIK